MSCTFSARTELPADVRHVTTVLLAHEEKLNSVLERWTNRNEELMLRMHALLDTCTQRQEAVVIPKNLSAESTGSKRIATAITGQKPPPNPHALDSNLYAVPHEGFDCHINSVCVRGANCVSDLVALEPEFAPVASESSYDVSTAFIHPGEAVAAKTSNCRSRSINGADQDSDQDHNSTNTPHTFIAKHSSDDHATSSLQMANEREVPDWITSRLSGGGRRPVSASGSLVSFGEGVQTTLPSVKARSLQKITEMVRGSGRTTYELVLSTIIVLNALWIGLYLQLQTAARIDYLDDVFHTGAIIFCIIFTAEYLIRFFAEAFAVRSLRLGFRFFFRGQDQGYNILDGIVVLSMLVEQSLLAFQAQDSYANEQISTIRLLRLLRLLRVFRVSRVLALFIEIRRFFLAIYRGLRAMIWIMLITTFMLYLVGIFLTEAAVEYCGDDTKKNSGVCKRFGTLFACMMSLFQALFGGVPWAELLEVVDALGAFYSFVFVSFIFVGIVVILNIIVAIFIDVHNETKNAERDFVVHDFKENRNLFVKRLRQIFYEIDINNSGSISKDKLQMAFEDEEISALVAAEGLSVLDAEKLFQLLAHHETDCVSIEDFLDGCSRLRGQAGAVDTAMLQMQFDQILSHVQELRLAVNAKPGRVSVKVSQRDDVKQDENHASEVHVGVRPWRTSCRRESYAAVDRELRSRRTFRRTIPNVEMRALSLDELQSIRELITLYCVTETWKSVETRRLLEPSMVNLYDFCYYHIDPSTVPHGVTIEVANAQEYTEGSRVTQKDATHILAQGILVESSQEGKLQIEVTKGRFRMSVDKPNARTHCNEIDVGAILGISPIGDDISYKEYLSNVALKPEWFCSHWWGEPVFNFVMCCEGHARLRKLREGRASYWVCAYANRQHDLGIDINDDPERSSFYKAMRCANGTLLILDEAAITLQRIWCAFEIFRTIADGRALDIVTISEDHQKRPHLLSEQPLPNETPWIKSQRESDFPQKLLVHGMTVSLQDGKASHAEDKQRILDSMALDIIRKQEELGQHISETSALDSAVRQANASLNAYFAVAAWPRAVKQGIVQQFDQTKHVKEGFGKLSLPQILRQDDCKESLSLSFSHMLEVGDAELRALAEGLPNSLLKLHLSFEGCRNVTDRGLFSLAHSLPESIKRLHLDFFGCEGITDVGFEELSNCLPPALVSLRLDFAKCKMISTSGVRTLAQSLPRNLQKCAVTLKGSRCDRNFATIAELSQLATRKSRTSLNFMNG